MAHPPLFLDAGDVADGAAGGAGGPCGVGLEGLGDLAGALGRLPCGCAAGLHRLAADQGDGTGLGRLGRDMADAEAGAAAGEAAVGDEGVEFAEALRLEVAGGVPQPSCDRFIRSLNV